MKKDVLVQEQVNSQLRPSSQNSDHLSDNPTITYDDEMMMDIDHSPEVSLQPLELTAEAALAGVDPTSLKRDQRRAFDIVAWHLHQTVNSMLTHQASPPPLRMILYGEGGTGKSKVIQTITDVFKSRGVAHMLVKSAYTGIAASLINGKTIHTIAHLSTARKPSQLSDESKAALQTFWKDRRYLIIDEYSMISKELLAYVSRNISIGLQESNVGDYSFGGLSVILCGDLHQFPPVGYAKRQAIFYPLDPIYDQPEEVQIGRRIYEDFTTVFILKEQIRVTDPTWKEFLTALRYGQVTDEHLTMLRSSVLGNVHSSPTDFGCEPWASAALVTPRHAVRRHWNDSASQKWCADSGEQLFICNAQDTIKGKSLNFAERQAMALREGQGVGKRSQQRRSLPSEIALSRGMKVMVTNNIQTDLDITNGARGEIVKIVFNPEEPPFDETYQSLDFNTYLSIFW